MTIRTLFSRKIRGESLKNLVEALGSDCNDLWRATNEFTVIDVFGKTAIKPVKEGLDVELDLYNTEVHVNYGANGKATDRTYKKWFCRTIRDIIPYTKK